MTSPMRNDGDAKCARLTNVRHSLSVWGRFAGSKATRGEGSLFELFPIMGRAPGSAICLIQNDPCRQRAGQITAKSALVARAAIYGVCVGVAKNIAPWREIGGAGGPPPMKMRTTATL